METAVEGPKEVADSLSPALRQRYQRFRIRQKRGVPG